MNEEPSQTALTAAAARAAHLMVDDEPLIFTDALAFSLLGGMADELTGYHRLHGTHPVLAGARGMVVTRSRYTEDRLAESGVGQYVVLGAGLDSYAYRSDSAVRVFEVDHPATQNWKRRLLAEAGREIPPTVTYVPADFEQDSLAECLAGCGFDPGVPALLSWLGVTMYLTADAIARTLDDLSGLAPGTELVFDYLLPTELRDTGGQAYADAVMPVAASQGEPWLTFFRPDELPALLERHGFVLAEQLSQRDCVDPSLWIRTDALRPVTLSVIARATI